MFLKGLLARLSAEVNKLPNILLFRQTLNVDSFYFSMNRFLIENLLTDLSEAADVYSDWIDACEAANQ